MIFTFYEFINGGIPRFILLATHNVARGRCGGRDYRRYSICFGEIIGKNIDK